MKKRVLTITGFAEPLAMRNYETVKTLGIPSETIRFELLLKEHAHIKTLMDMLQAQEFHTVVYPDKYGIEQTADECILTRVHSSHVIGDHIYFNIEFQRNRAVSIEEYQQAWRKNQTPEMVRLHGQLMCNYVLSGKVAVPCPDLAMWTDWRVQNKDAMIVAQTDVGSQHVSTVFLGIDHNFMRGGPPILFETLVFPDAEIGDRYSTWEEAEQGHAEIVAELKGNLN